MTAPLIPARSLFRFSVPCLKREPLWTSAGANLDESYCLPRLGELEGGKTFADVRAAWNTQGLVFAVRVDGKNQPPWCRESRPDDSDGLRVWIDTRDTHNVHRATRFCHQFIFMPTGGGRNLEEPVAEQLLIHRARENARPIRPGILQSRREKRVGGYTLEAFIPAEALTGFDPQEHQKLGFTFAVVDRELGTQAFSCSEEFPYREDPSVWTTLELAS
jgi:hypothetical protein